MRVLGAVPFLAAVALAGPTVQVPKADLTLQGTGPVTVSMLIGNPDATTVTIPIDVVLPAGWRLIVPPDAVTLEPGETQPQFFSLLPPSDLPAGTYTVLIRAAGNTLPVQLRVTGSPRLRVDAASRQPYSLDATTTHEFTVVNAGNVAQVVTFTAINSLGWALDITPKTATLRPGERQSVTVRARRAGNAPSTGTSRVTLTAQSVDVKAQATSAVPLLTRDLPRDDVQYSVKGSASLQLDPLTGETVAALQLRGRLTEALPGTFDVNVRPKSFSVTYAADTFQVSAGNVVMGISPLLPSASTIGVSASRTLTSGLRLEGLVGQSDGQVAAGVGLRGETDWGAWHTGIQWRDGSAAASVGGVYRSERLSGEASAAYDLTHGGLAMSAAARARAGDLTFSVTANHRDAAFLNGGTGATSASTSASWSHTVAPKVNVSFGVKGSLALLETERRATWGADAQVRTPRMTTTASYAAVRSSSGTSQDKLAASVDVQNLKLTADWTRQGTPLSERNTMTVSAQTTVRTGGVLITPKVGVTVDLTGGGQVTLPAQVMLASGPGQGPGWAGQLSLSTLNLLALSESYRVGLGVSHTSEQGTRIVGSVNASTQNNVTTTAVRLGVTTPLNVATGVRSGIGCVQGRVTHSGTGVAGIKLRLGDLYAATGSDGTFRFPNVHKGTPVLTLLNGNETGWAPSDQAPRPVQVSSGACTVQDFALVRAATIRGTIRIASPPAPAPGTEQILPPPLSLENLRITASSANASFSAEVGLDGQFAITGLFPDLYDLQLVDTEGKIVNGYLAEGLGTVKVHSGGESVRTIVVHPVIRTVTVDDGGEVNAP